MSGLGDIALLAAIKGFARGKRWRVVCATCGDTRIAGTARELGEALFAHTHDGEVNLTIQSGKRTGP